MKNIRVGTDCSGIEAPIQALRNLQRKYPNEVGFTHEFSSEIDKYTIESLRANYSPKYLYGDMTIRDHSSLPDIDLYVCGFPCQPFSSAGERKGFEDPRGNIFFHCIYTIMIKQPKYFVLENVKGLTYIEGGKVFKRVLNILDKYLSKDYSITYKVLNTKDYGIPQNRERLFIIGTKGSQTFEWPSPQPTRIVKLDPSKINDRKKLMKRLDSFIDHESKEPGYVSKDVKSLLKRIPKESKFINLGFRQNAYVNADIYAPCLTTSGLWCVPYRRDATIREYLKLQGFPINFIQCVSDAQLKKQIGNSMSVCVLQAIFEQLVKA